MSGSSTIDGGSVTTTGGQTYTGAVTLGAADTTLTGTLVKFGSTLDGQPSVGGGNTGYGGTLDAAPALSIVGNASFGGVVGGTATALASLWVSGTTALDGGSVSTTGGQTYTGAAPLGANAILTGSAVTFGSTLDGAYVSGGNGGYGGTLDAAPALTITGNGELRRSGRRRYEPPRSLSVSGSRRSTAAR